MSDLMLAAAVAVMTVNTVREMAGVSAVVTSAWPRTSCVVYPLLALFTLAIAVMAAGVLVLANWL